MIDNIRIRNYKSIVDLTLDLGRFNVIIGTNGCGKSNILEAITMGALGVSDNADIAHNPYVLDGLDLSDDEQRLFVCRRDIDGHTRIERIKYREDRKMSLSELCNLQ